MRLVTVTPNGNAVIQDTAPVEGNIPGTSASVNIYAGIGAVFTCTEKQFDDSVRPQLEFLASQRIRQVSGGALLPNTMPLLTWTSEHVPGGRPRVYDITGGMVPGLSLGGASVQDLTLVGLDLIPGLKASTVIGSGTSSLTLTAVRKGPSGDLISVQINPPFGSGSVTDTLSGDGKILITVVPAAAGATADDVATQINDDTIAALFVLAVGGGTGKVPAQSIATPLTGGSGAGVAWADIPSAVAGSYLRFEALGPGNSNNLINLTIAVAAGSGSVTVSGTSITVVPATAANTITGVKNQLNAYPAAAALGIATVIGTGASAEAPIGPIYLAGGAGETPVITVGGTPVQALLYTDTSIELAVTVADLTAIAGDSAQVVLTNDWGLMQGGSVKIVA